MSFFADLDHSDEGLGGKARSLARLASAGFSTPAGFVVRDALFRCLCPTPRTQSPDSVFDDAALLRSQQIRAELERAPWPVGFVAELDARLDRIGGARFSIRSSFASEDAAGALAAGVYESRTDVPLAAVGDAIRHVLASAVAPGAAAYAVAHGWNPGAAPVAVLVHSYVAGNAEGSAAYAPDAEPEPVLMVRRGSLSASAENELRAALAKLARRFGPVEIEWVSGEHGLVFLQERPYQPKAARAEWSGFAELEPAQPGRAAWRWDVAHNPLPLSAAQAGLVSYVDERCRVGIRQRVLGGYLFYTPDTRPLPTRIDPRAAGSYFEDLWADFQAQQSILGPAPPLAAALAQFASVYERIFGVLQPALRQARSALRELLLQHAPSALPLVPALCAGVPSKAEKRRVLAATIRRASDPNQRTTALAEYLALFGDEAPIWDVSAPTYAEDPSPLLVSHGNEASHAAPADWKAAAETVEAGLAEEQRSAWPALLALAREAVALSEADDWLYARAQARVRRALLARGRELVRDGYLAADSDVFLLPLCLVREIDRGGPVPADLDAVASEGRQAWQRARQAPPPGDPTADDGALRGHGTGGHAIGRIAVHHAGAPRGLPADAVLLATTLLPTELPLIAAAALVTETGGPLDHVAAQARERGIPAVVGAAGAKAMLADGDLVLVDADRGLVVKLAGR